MDPITEEALKEALYELNDNRPLTSWELDFFKELFRYIKKKQEEENEVSDTSL